MVTESTFRPAAWRAESMRLRTIRTCSGKFCGPINILDTEPLRYTSLAEIACVNFRESSSAYRSAPGKRRDFCPVGGVERAPSGNCKQALGAPMAVDIAQLLAFAVKNNASDLHLSAGVPPMIRVDGDMKRINMPALAHKEVHSMVYDIMNDKQRKAFEEFFETDFSFEIPKLARFRVNAFNQNRGAGAVFRN